MIMGDTCTRPCGFCSVDKGKTLGMTHNLGGRPGECVSFAAIVGSELG